MKILGDKVINRTENWKTVKHFYGLKGEAKARLTGSLLAHHLGTDSGQIPVDSDDVEIGLFWYGMRDYVHQDDRQTKKLKAVFANIYNLLFSNLRNDLKVFRQKLPYRFPEMRPYHYALPDPTYESKFYNNLTSTEVDVVLETSDYLLIGECKHESDLGVNPDYILVHQVIRQYVMARILVNHISASSNVKEKKVVPFIVGDKDKLPSIRNSTQIKFMTESEMPSMSKKNVLTWNCIEKLAGGP